MNIRTLFCSLLLAAIPWRAFAQATFTRITTGPIATNLASGAGATWVDYDNDGDLDLFLVNRDGPNQLYRNEGNGTFIQINDGPIVNSGLDSHSISWADFDNDGRIDLFVGNTSKASHLFYQQPDGTFVQTSLGSLTALGAASVDYENDGWLDLGIANFSVNELWHNNGKGLVAMRISTIDVSGNAMTWADYDNDGDMDLLVTEDSGSGGGSSRLYLNDGHGVFTRIANTQLTQQSTSVRGAAWGDYDNDGFLDLFLARGNSALALSSVLFRNTGSGTLMPVQPSSFVNDFGHFGSSVWVDYDNDGWLDLFVTESDAGKNWLYHNNGDGTFSRVLIGAIVNDVANSCCGSWGDYDRDGFLDLFVANVPPYGGAQLNSYLYHNDGNSNAWITVKCVGTRSNRSAIGAKVRVKATIKGKTFWQLREINTGTGWWGVPLEVHFGLGDATNVEILRIEWPSGTVQQLQNVPGKQYLTVTEPSRLSISVINSVPQLILSGGRNQQYEIQMTTDFTDWSLFKALTITNVEGTALITDTNAAGPGRRFYRAVLR